MCSLFNDDAKLGNNVMQDFLTKFWKLVILYGLSTNERQSFKLCKLVDAIIAPLLVI